ncbi:2-methylcitrate dehydratase PrpD [Paucimonas lemoignei]|uniref:2-methylcitrate dehydratase PrpD n=2 Tax=Paucimonas lemoignei TaxID=29443 RepID=A0A4R3HTQ2_PAULE|nr:2-methylcitrate dehydratase PrpD [Paucimonas lemoignei]
MTTNMTGIFARFVSGLTMETIPAEVIEKTRACILNGYGIALGSHTTAFFPVAARSVLMLDGVREKGATLLRDGRKTSAAGAALANAALFHGRAQEDTCGVAHFGAILLPLLTALIENGEGEVADFIPALVAGYEVGGALESAYSPQTTAAGLRATPLYGTIAAAAAVARLWKLDVDQTGAALANAASFSGGILQSFGDGTDEWRYQVGIAGRNGLTAAALALQGSVSAANAFEGRAGFVRAFVRTDCDVEHFQEKLGREWSVMKVTFKPYPVCALNQTPVNAALRLRERIQAPLQSVKSVKIYLNPTVVGYAGMNTRGPFKSVSGTLMSIQYCVATTLLNGVPTVAQMSKFDDSDINAFMSRVTPVADASLGLLACRIEVEVEGQAAPLIEEFQADHATYSYDRAGVSRLIRQIGEETGVAAQSYACLEKFVEELPRADLNDVLNAFRPIQRPVDAVAGRAIGAQ